MKNIINLSGNPNIYLIINTNSKSTTDDISNSERKDFNTNVNQFAEKYNLKINRVDLLNFTKQNEYDLTKFIASCLITKITGKTNEKSIYKSKKFMSPEVKKRTDVETPNNITWNNENCVQKDLSMEFSKLDIACLSPSQALQTQSPGKSEAQFQSPSLKGKEGKCLIF